MCVKFHTANVKGGKRCRTPRNFVYMVHPFRGRVSIGVPVIFREIGSVCEIPAVIRVTWRHIQTLRGGNLDLKSTGMELLSQAACKFYAGIKNVITPIILHYLRANEGYKL